MHRSLPLQASHSYQTEGGITIHRTCEAISYEQATDPLVTALDTQLGVLLVSDFESPGRYTRWDIGFINPPLQIIAQQKNFSIVALNKRGELLLTTIISHLKQLDVITNLNFNEYVITGEVVISQEYVSEELRSKQASIFSVLRILLKLFKSPEDAYLGLYGAFGYDLAFQFEPIKLTQPRDNNQRDLVLFLPDELIIVDHHRQLASKQIYEFTTEASTTVGLPRSGDTLPFTFSDNKECQVDHEPGEYADLVRKAQVKFKQGDLFEVVPSQLFTYSCDTLPSELFTRLRRRNPAPYSFLINLGHHEYLVGTSPEMYVRVTGKYVETSPISGTIARGQTPLEDAENILTLLNSQKDQTELTMCTDVDRNDKSRVCVPGTVKVIGRRLIEMYSKLIHTVDHVEGILSDDYDALDAFLSHAWAVTVTGAPKVWAMQFIEEHEKSARCWYGGAIGCLNFNGNMNTGLTLRTIHIKNHMANVRAGATLLHDSNPEAEEAETRLKASALLEAIRYPISPNTPIRHSTQHAKLNKRIILVDHQDSFVHTLANYFRQTGAEVHTLRAGFSLNLLDSLKPDLIVLSPGPGRPTDFNLNHTIDNAITAQIPIFGVCLGLQGIVEYFGGSLAILDNPMHGKSSKVYVQTQTSKLFTDLPNQFTVGRYHSLFAQHENLPDALQITATTADKIIMAIEHISLPIAGVQFHPESIMTTEKEVGFRLITNVVKFLTKAY